jgi:hypothetical protein
MKNMMIAATVLGAGIAALILIFRKKAGPAKQIGNLDRNGESLQIPGFANHSMG